MAHGLVEQVKVVVLLATNLTPNTYIGEITSRSSKPASPAAYPLHLEDLIYLPIEMESSPAYPSTKISTEDVVVMNIEPSMVYEWQLVCVNTLITYLSPSLLRPTNSPDIKLRRILMHQPWQIPHHDDDLPKGLQSSLDVIMSAISYSRTTLQSQGQLAMDTLINNQVGLAYTLKHIYSGQQFFLS